MVRAAAAAKIGALIRARRNLAPPNSESGLIGVGTVIAIGIAAFFVYLLLGAFEGDSDSFGGVPVPSTSLVELPDGEIDLFYAEGVTGIEENLSLVQPDDLSYALTLAGGVSVRIDSRGGEVERTDDGVARVVAAAFVPEEGTYEVRVESQEVAGRIRPQLTFGQGPFGAVKERFESVVDELNGPTGIAAAAALGLLFLLPMMQRAMRRTGGA